MFLSTCFVQSFYVSQILFLICCCSSLFFMSFTIYHDHDPSWSIHLPANYRSIYLFYVCFLQYLYSTQRSTIKRSFDLFTIFVYLILIVFSFSLFLSMYLSFFPSISMWLSNFLSHDLCISLPIHLSINRAYLSGYDM